jgi:hypothetical protein
MNFVFSIISLFFLNFGTVVVDETSVLNYPIEHENVIGIDKESFIVNNNNGSYLIFEENEFFVSTGDVINYVTMLDKIVLLVDNGNDSNIITFNKTTFKFNTIQVDNISGNDILLSDDYIYIVGNTTDDYNAVIFVFDLTIKEVNRYYFEGDGYISIQRIFKIDNYFYITIYKESLCNNSDFVNTGNENEMSSILVKLNNNFDIVNTLYLSEEGTNEKISDITYINNYIELILNSDNKYYYYKVNLNLNIENYKFLDCIFNRVFLLPNNKSKYGLLILDKNFLKLITNNDLEEIYEFKKLDYIYDSKIINCELVLYGVYQDNVEIVKFSEYEIVKLDDATFSKKYINEYSTSHFKVESWFEVLEFNLDYTIPYFDKNICGVYDAFYVSFRENGTTININTNIIIKPYTNFIDGGVYNKGKVLEFLGYAKINNTGIYYGTSLEQAGEYIIEIIDCNLNSTFYKLKIVDDYYYKQNDDFIPSDIYINYNESASLRFYVKNALIDSVIVDEEYYYDYYLDSNYLIINFNHIGINQTEVKILNSINLIIDDNIVEVAINKPLVITYLKDLPNIYIEKKINYDNLETNILVNDKTRSFVGIKKVGNDVDILANNKLLSTSENEDIKLYFMYSVGDGVIREDLLCEYSSKQEGNISISFSYETEELKNIKIIFDAKEELLKLNVDEVSYLMFYNDTEKISFLNPVIKITIGILIVNIIGILLMFIIKKIKQKRLRF